MVFHSLLLEKLVHWGLEKCSVWQLGNWLAGSSRVGISSSFSNQQPVTSEVPWDIRDNTLVSSKVVWKMGSSVPWWQWLMIPTVGKWTHEKGEPPCRMTWIGCGLTRTLGSSTRASVRFCTWESIIRESSRGWDLTYWGTVEWHLGILVNSEALYEWAVHCCGRVKMTGCWFSSTTASAAKVKMSLSHSSQWLSGNTWNSLFSFGLSYKKRSCAQAAEGPEKAHKSDPGTGKLATERTVFVQPWEKKTKGRPYHHI